MFSPVKTANFTGVLLYCFIIESNVIMWPMENINLEILKQIEERKRIQGIKNVTRACKDKLYEIVTKEKVSK